MMPDFDLREQGVGLVVALDDRGGGVLVLAHEGVDAVRDHAYHRAGQVADQPGVLGGEGPMKPGGVRDVQRLVADSLHVGYHLQRGGDEAQVAGHRLLLEQQLEADGLYLALLLVYLVLQVAHARAGVRSLSMTLRAVMAMASSQRAPMAISSWLSKRELLVEFYAHINRTSR